MIRPGLLQKPKYKNGESLLTGNTWHDDTSEDLNLTLLPNGAYADGVNGIGAAGDEATMTIYVLGGSSGGAFKDAFYALNLSTGNWTQLAAFPAGPASSVGMTFYDGKIYTYGGYVGSSTAIRTFYSYDVATDAWTNLGPMPYQAEGTGVSGPLVLAMSDGSIFITGGAEYGGATNGSKIVTSASYDVAAGTWTQLADLPYAGDVVGDAFSITAEEQVHVRVPERGYYTYTPSTNDWALIELVGSQVQGAAAGVMVDSAGDRGAYLHTACGYDLGTNQQTDEHIRWLGPDDGTIPANMPVAPLPVYSNAQGAVRMGGLLFMIGGIHKESGSFPRTRKIQAYVQPEGAPPIK